MNYEFEVLHWLGQQKGRSALISFARRHLNEKDYLLIESLAFFGEFIYGMLEKERPSFSEFQKLRNEKQDEIFRDSLYLAWRGKLIEKGVLKED